VNAGELKSTVIGVRGFGKKSMAKNAQFWGRIINAGRWTEIAAEIFCSLLLASGLESGPIRLASITVALSKDF
jgi:hypothetical protein